MLRLPDQVPNGVRLRVLLLLDDAMNAVPMQQPEERRRRKPSPKLAGSVVMYDDLMAPAVPEEDWNTLK